MSAGVIGGYSVSAPMFRKATEAELLAIVALISEASYHYAEDTGKEIGLGNMKMREAARAINNLELFYCPIKALYNHAPQLATFDALINTVIRYAREDT